MACAMWDFTIPFKSPQNGSIAKHLYEICKNYTFQLEKGESGYEHYQGRFSLRKKKTLKTLISLFTDLEYFKGIHFSPTCNNVASTNNFSYVMKLDTRIDGPWSDTDYNPEESYIPKQYRNLTLYKWQEEVIKISENFNDREINVIYDDVGCNGKSTLASIVELQYNGIDLPPINDMKELIATMCNICMDTNNRSPKMVFIDLPRAVDKARLNGIYSAIEQIKKGKLYDMRYKYKKYWIDSPAIWVFTNMCPDEDMLSRDRWKIWQIIDNVLFKYNKKCLIE